MPTSTVTAAGPAPAAVWTLRCVDGHDPVVAVADAANAPSHETFHCLNEMPAVARRDGAPLLSLTLLLQRPPHLDDDDITPLIERAACSFTVSVTPTPSALAAQSSDRVTCSPLFAHEVRYAVRDTIDDATIAEARAVGADTAAALSCSVGAMTAKALLDALDGQPSQLELAVEVTYRSAPVHRRIALSGMWAPLYDELAARAAADGTLDLADVAAAFASSIAAADLMAAVSVADDDRLLAADDASAGLDALLLVSGVVLDRLTPGLERSDPANRFRLRRRPPESMPIDVSIETDEPELVVLDRTVPLETVLGGVLDGLDRDRFVRLTAVAADLGGIVDVPRRVRSRARRDVRRTDLVLSAGKLQALPVVLAADPKPSLVASALVAASSKLSALTVLGDDVVVDQVDRPEPGPVVRDVDALLFEDRIDPGTRWYVPGWQLRAPTPNAPATSPFLFRFTTAGLVGGESLAHGIVATVRLTLDQIVPQAVKDELGATGNPTATPVPTSELRAAIELPYRVKGSGERATQLLDCTVTPADDGSLVVEAVVNDDWARLLYGALSTPGLQSEPVRVTVSFAFAAWSVVDENVSVVSGGKQAMVAVLARRARATAPTATERAVTFDPTALAVRGPDGVVHLEREADDVPRRSRPRARRLATAALVAPKKLVAVDAIDTKVNTLVPLKVDPPLQIDPNLIIPQPSTTYVRRSVAHAARVDVAVSCADAGELYRQGDAGQDVAVGCQDALRLGEAPPQRYAEVTELAASSHRVFRSLQQPGHFLLVPAAFRIGRYAAADGPDRAYRPCVLLHATLGTQPADNRYVLSATLQPDIPWFERARLMARLAGLVPQGVEPTVRLPLDPAVQATLDYEWTLPADVAEPLVARSWDGFQVSVTTPLTEALLVNNLVETSGLMGEVTFTFPDGEVMSSMLALDTNVVGPWNESPLAVRVAGTNATITNHTERRADVFELDAVDDRGVTSVACDCALEAGASTSVALPAPAVRADAVFHLASAALKIDELDVFVEDITTNVVFVNLVSYPNHDLARLDVHVRLAGATSVDDLALAEGQTGQVQLTLPLTTYLGGHPIEVRFTKTTTGGTSTETPWLPWDTAAQGCVISITWDLIA